MAGRLSDANDTFVWTAALADVLADRETPGAERSRLRRLFWDDITVAPGADLL